MDKLWLQPCGVIQLTVILLLLRAVPSSKGQSELGELHYSIQEELPTRTEIANIITDAQLDLKYDENDLKRLRFSLHERRGTRPGFKDFFVIDRDGTMRTSQVIDRDAICAHQTTCPIPLNIMVQPGAYFQIIKLTVHIVDINDNSPVFPQQTLELSISESTLPGAVFALPSAEDYDSGSYTIQKYHLVSTSDKFDLRVTNSSIGSVDLQLVLTKTVDRELEQMYQMEVVAVDGGTPPRSGVIQIHVKVIDANDNNPTFDNYTYEVTVAENSPVGMIILRVHATDPDSGVNGEVFYKLSDRSKQEHGDRFGIEEQTGDLYLRSNLDYEIEQAYYLTITAQDQGPNSLPAYAKVIVKVGDINDHTPEITVNSLTPSGLVQVEEGSPEGTFVAHISVVDLDAGRSGEVRCSMDSYEFKLEQLYQTEYKIITTAVFDREIKSVYHLRIVCEDKGVPIQATSKHVVVTVIDANDNSPHFDKPVYVAQLQENLGKGAFIEQVSARDDDVGGNGALTYDILGQGVAAVVKINAETGVIRSNIVFDYERESSYTFTVIAKDNGDPVLTGSTTLKLNIKDTNDVKPVFTEPNYQFSIPENAPSNTYIGSVMAKDQDSYPYNQVVYSFDPYSPGLNTFSIDSKTGAISTLRFTDREKAEFYNMTVWARNEPDKHMKSSTNVSIRILDINDNAPIFDFPSDTNNTIQIATDVPIGTPIIKVKARDPDLGNNGSLSYYITHGNELGYFSINSTTGQMRLDKNLGGLRNQEFVIAITARDNGSGSALQSMMDLNIIANHSLAILSLHHGPAFSLEAFIRNPLLMGTLAAIILVLFLVCITICLLRCRRHKVHQNHKNHTYQQDAAMTAASRRPRNVKWKNNIEWKVIPNDYCSSEEMRQDGSPGRIERGRRERGSPTSPQKAQEDLWPPPPPPETQSMQVTTVHSGYDAMIPKGNGTLPSDRIKTLPHHNSVPHQSSPRHHHHHTMPPQHHKNHSPLHHPHPRPHPNQHPHPHPPTHPHPHHQSPTKHQAVPTTSSGVPVQGPSGHAAPGMRTFGSPQHQPAATVMPRSMHREHYQPLTQHDLEMHEMLHLLPHDKDSESGSYTDSGRGPSEEGDNSLDRHNANQPPVKETNIDSVRRPHEAGAAGAAGSAPHDRDYWMSPLTRIRDLKSYAPRQRSGLLESDSDACNSFDEPDSKLPAPQQQQQQQQQPQLPSPQIPDLQQQMLPPPPPPVTDANCNSNHSDKLTTASPCSTFLPSPNVLPRGTDSSTAHDNQCGNNAGNQDLSRQNNPHQNGNWERVNGNQSENYRYPPGTTDGPRTGNEEMPPGRSPWRRSWDVDSNAQSEGGTTTSGSYMVGDQDDVGSVYSSNTFIV